MKILIADDSRAMRQVISVMLREAGFRGHTIIEAKDGAQALALAQSEEPDVILSDWNMPEMTGIEFLTNLRATGSETPFGFVTTEVSPAMRQMAIEGGALFLIGKPFTSDDFQVALSKILD
jgi:two-component system chemotaxis response regulator CheY